MKVRKIRGHKRRWKGIEDWVLRSRNLDLEYLKEYERDYVKLRVHPWSGLSVINSEYPEPKRETKKRMIQGLIDIYNQWKKQLDELNEPYYLRIWLFEPKFSKTQVVCAIGENIDFYENTFFKPDIEKAFQVNRYGNFQSQLEDFKWDYRFDEYHLDNSEPGEPEDYASQADFEESRKWFEKMMKKPHRIAKLKEPIGEATEVYSIKVGDLWLGQKS